MIHKPSLWSRDVPQKIWARSVQPFRRLLDTNKQTDKPNLYIDFSTFSENQIDLYLGGGGCTALNKLAYITDNRVT